MAQNFNSNETKKAIIFARVSTESQNYDEQVSRMMAVAMADGYRPDNLITIAVKESAIKKSEEEREGLQLLKEAITNDPDINAIYVFEISRLGRRMDVICSVLEWLTNEHIQLVCDTPNVRLFDRNGNVDFAGQLLIYICGVMAAQEMKIKKERFANGKARAKSEGRWTGGSVMFGFKIENKREVIDEVAAEVVRTAYQMYANDENRTAQTNEDIANYLRANNVCVRSDKFFSASRVAKFIGQTKYRGTIVSAELWDKANSIRESNYRGSKERKQSFGERLIKCNDCGRNYRRVGEQYVCAGHKPEYKDSDMYCDNNATLNRKFVDCSLVETVAVWWLDEQTKDNSKRADDLKRTIEILASRIDANTEKLSKVEEKKKRIGKNYANMIIDDKEFDSQIAKINVEEKQLKSDVANMIARKAEYEQQLSNSNHINTPWSVAWKSFFGMTHAEMYQTIHNLVERVDVEVKDDEKYWTIRRKDSNETQTYMSCGKGAGVKLYGYVNGKAHNLTKDPAFRIDYDIQTANVNDYAEPTSECHSLLKYFGMAV